MIQRLLLYEINPPSNQIYSVYIYIYIYPKLELLTLLEDKLSYQNNLSYRNLYLLRDR